MLVELVVNKEFPLDSFVGGTTRDWTYARAW